MATLHELGYGYVPGPSGAQSDWVRTSHVPCPLNFELNDQVLRKLEDPSQGFEWKGQEDYDAVGAAVTSWVRLQLGSLYGLEEIHVEPATAFATPVVLDHTGPLLLLVCGSAPGAKLCLRGLPWQCSS